MKLYKQLLLSAAVFLVALIGKVYWESSAEFRRASELEAGGSLEESIIHYDRAIHWYFPGNPHVKKSILRLWNIGEENLEKNPRVAVLAYSAIRAGLHSIRHIYWPHKNWIHRANEKIAILRSQEESSDPQALAFHKKALELDERPGTFWVILLELGFLGWVGSVFGLIWKGFDQEGHMNARASLPWVFGIIGGFGIWILGMLKA